MNRFRIIALVTVAGLAPAAVRAQSVTPRVEVGFEASALLTRNRDGLATGPRLVVNFNARTALSVTASLQPLSSDSPLFQMKTDLFLATLKRVVGSAGPARVFATIGGGAEYVVIHTPVFVFGDPPVTFPATTGRQLRPAFAIGGGVDFRIGSRLAVVLESVVVLTERFDGRLSAGLLVPLGRYSQPAPPLASSVPWAALDDGDRAWVTTTDGREIDGEVEGRSASQLDIRTRAGLVSLSSSEIRAIDTTDPVRNGAILGAKIGAGGAIVPAVFISYLTCALEVECSAGDVVAVNAIFIGLGTGIGAAAGAITDSLRERRAPVYRRGGSPAVTVVPIVRKHSVGLGAAIRW
jgi:hypothetical protein